MASIDELLALANNQALELFQLSMRGGTAFNQAEQAFVKRMVDDCLLEREISIPDLEALDRMWERYVGVEKYGVSNARWK